MEDVAAEPLQQSAIVASTSANTNLITIIAMTLAAINLLVLAAGVTYLVRRRRQQLQQVREGSRVAAVSGESANRSGLRSVASTVRSFSSFASKFGGSQFSEADDNSIESL